MNTSAPPPPQRSTEASVKSILAWIRLTQGRDSDNLSEQLLRQVNLLRETAIPGEQRIKLLNLLANQAECAVNTELRHLRKVSLPISRSLRHRVRTLLDTLEALTQDYLLTLARISTDGDSQLHTSLRRVINCTTWQIRITHLIASPQTPGIWLRLHNAFRTARDHGVERLPGPNGTPSIQRIYMNAVLAGIAQPASFSSGELEFINEYIERCLPETLIEHTPPLEGDHFFWIDLNKDTPAQATTRHPASANEEILYFSCSHIAHIALKHRQALHEGASPEVLNLPKRASPHIGPGILKHLHTLWGQPAKRRFQRRRQAYRGYLHTGLKNLWTLLKQAEEAPTGSEWMITNESPDGYALMHICGHIGHFRVGDIVSLQPFHENTLPSSSQERHICIIRWAISENAEHIELGVQLLASSAQAAEVIHPDLPHAGKIPALILPETPPIRPLRSIVVPTGHIPPANSRIIAIIEGENLEVREMQTHALDEQGANIEIFSVSPDH